MAASLSKGRWVNKPQMVPAWHYLIKYDDNITMLSVIFDAIVCWMDCHEQWSRPRKNYSHFYLMLSFRSDIMIFLSLLEWIIQWQNWIQTQLFPFMKNTSADAVTKNDHLTHQNLVIYIFDNNLVRVMTCCLLGIKVILQTILTYCQLDSKHKPAEYRHFDSHWLPV